MSTTLTAIPPKRILLVEDDLVAGHTLRLALSVDHHVVDLVADAEEGLSHFDKNPYDLVIADFRLPNMDGLELAEAVKQRVPSCPVILITAYSDPAQGHLGKVSNVDVLLEKPVSMIRLHDALRRFFSTAIV